MGFVGHGGGRGYPLGLLLQLLAYRGGEDVMNNTGICLALMAAGVLALAGCSRESADWKSASAADTTEAYQQFLQQYPKSAESAQAQARIKQIADDHDWQAAAAADTRDAYEQFVTQHADSKWAQEARIRIENFAQSGVAHGSAAPGQGSAPMVAGAPAAAAADAPVSPSPGATGPLPATPPAPPSSKTSAHAAKVASAATRATRGHFAQLGAFHSKERAEAAWKKLAARYPTELKSLKPHVVAGNSKHGAVYKLRVSVASSSDARSLCATMKKHAQACVPVTA
jgi:cell division septation protein DedD